MRAVLVTLISVLVVGCASPRLDPLVFGSESDGHAHDHGAHAPDSRVRGPRVRDPGGHAGHGHGGHAHHPPRRLLRSDMRRGWTQAWTHHHDSGRGTPYVHSFLIEPAYLGRDLLVNYVHEPDESEIEAELEFALTRRLGVIIALPYIDGEDEAGIGDAALGLRALLIESPDFVLSVSGEVELPTGDADRDLGRGEAAIAAFVHTWMDLGEWVTLQTQLGIEHVPEEDESELIWRFGLSKSWCTCPLFGHRGVPAHEGHGPHAFTLMAEVAGVTGLAADESGTTGRWLVGAAYPLLDRVDARAAYFRTFDGEDGWLAGLIFHL